MAASQGRVLIGAEYLDGGSHLRVRVVDTQRSGAGAHSFVVESVNGERPGERWLCAAASLLDEKTATRSAVRAPPGALTTLADLVRRAERRSAQGEPSEGEHDHELAAALRALAEELVAGGAR